MRRGAPRHGFVGGWRHLQQRRRRKEEGEGEKEKEKEGKGPGGGRRGANKSVELCFAITICFQAFRTCQVQQGLEA